MTAAVVIFTLAYAGIALGGVPGLAIDRTGVALLGAIAMVATGALTEAQALAAIDVPTLLLLFGLMVVSSQLAAGGGYGRAALWLERGAARPRTLLAQTMVVAAALSSVLTNDVVCLALAPLYASGLRRAGLRPLPFLLGLAVAANIGSAATIIGNPQNMLIGQVGRLHFGRFAAYCAAPTLLSLGLAIALLLGLHGRRLVAEAAAEAPAELPPFDAHQSRKGALAIVLVVALFFTSIPRELTALSVAGWLLASRKMSTRRLLGEVDWHLITLFCGLFVVVRGIELTGLPARAVAALAARGLDLTSPGVMTFVAAALSNVVSNVPSTMMLVRFLDPARPAPWYVLSLAATFAGNLVTIGSIANLIVIEQARQCGVRVGFREHARVGVPVTLLSLGVTVLWARLVG